MASTEHLKKYQFTSNQDIEKQKINGAKGGKQKAKNQAEAKKFAAALELTLGKAAPIALTQLVEKIKSGELNDKSLTELLKFYADYTGQKPSEKLESDVEVKITRKSI